MWFEVDCFYNLSKLLDYEEGMWHGSFTQTIHKQAEGYCDVFQLIDDDHV